MANPQSENGHTDIANEILEALCKINLSSYQSRILNAIFRKTYGWNKKSDWISNSQLVELTGLKKQHVSRALSELKKRNMIIREGRDTSFQKDYDQWKELPRKVTKLPKEVTVTNTGNSVTNTGNGVTSTGAHKRNYTKETIQKNKYIDIFEFWNSAKIIVHRDNLIKTHIPAMKKAMEYYWLEDIYNAICNYKEVYNSDLHYFSHKWDLTDFLKRGLKKFIDESDPLDNFLSNKIQTGKDQPPAHNYQEL